MAGAKTNLLTDVTTREVSIVDRGAVRRKFLFRKNEEQPMYEEIIKACIETPLENEDAIDASLEKRGVEKKTGAAIKAAIRVLSAFKDNLQDSHKAALRSLMDEASDDDDDADEDAKTTKKKADTQPEDVKKDESVAMTPEVKAQFESVRKAQEAASAEAVALRKKLDEYDNKEHLRRCVEKAEKDFRHLGPAKVVGGVLQKLEKAGLAEEIEAVLRGANERARLGGTEKLLKEQGSDHGWGDADDDTADARLQKAAVAIAKADNVPLMVAHAKACEAHPELYAQYQREMAHGAKEGR